MGQRRGAARREQRQAKRAVARAERGDQKYRNQKGGTPLHLKKGKRISKRRPEHGGDEEVEDQMVVVRDGRPTVSGGRAPLHSGNARASEAVLEGEEDTDARFTATEKKVRALEKKLKHVTKLKATQAQGFELDAQQQAKLRAEKKLRQELAQFQEQLELERAAEGEDEGDEDGEVEGDIAGEDGDGDGDSDEDMEDAGGPPTAAPIPRFGAGQVATQRASKSGKTSWAEVAPTDPLPGPVSVGRLAQRRIEKARKLEERRQRKRARADAKESEREAAKAARRELAGLPPTRAPA
uniref:Uncharacterized protein n=1 Tax=Coccolithus braarudii TaxID=221442 RepID=A0A7S0LC83_9EUKA